MGTSQKLVVVVKKLLLVLILLWPTIVMALEPIVPEGNLTQEQIALVKRHCDNLDNFTITILIRKDYLGGLYGDGWVHEITRETTPNGACMVDAITNEGEIELLFTFMKGRDNSYYQYRIINRF